MDAKLEMAAQSHNLASMYNILGNPFNPLHVLTNNMAQHIENRKKNQPVEEKTSENKWENFLLV